MHYGLSKSRVVFTIHNLEFGANNIGKAMAYSDKATTVSNCCSFFCVYLVFQSVFFNNIFTLL